jgi:hypothetical protein
MGARFEDAPDTFAWFWDQEPQVEVGHSILVYAVPKLLDPTAPPVNLALADAALKELPDSLFEDYFHTNDVQVRWFDSQRALVFPAGEDSWLITAEQSFVTLLADPSPLSLVNSIQTANGEILTLYQVSDTGTIKDYFATQAVNSFSLPEPTNLVHDSISFDSTLSFLGYQWLSQEIAPGSTIQLLTYWQVEAATSQALAFFVHFRDEDGRILAQHDGMDVVSQSWHSGDLLLQLHELTLPTTLPETADWLALGVYDADTLIRLPVIVGGQIVSDHLLLPKPDQ